MAGFLYKDPEKMQFMKPTSFFSIIVLLTIIFSSCDNDTVIRKKISGRPGDLVIVIPQETWDGQVGEAMKKVLMQSQIGLPQKEPIFSIIDVPPIAFKEIFQSNRNIIYTRISPTLDSSRVEFKADVWAWPQSVVNIFARNSNEFIELFNKNSDRIVGYLLRSERERLQRNNVSFPEKGLVNLFKNKFNIEMDVPTGYKLAKEMDNFLWIRYDTPEITQSIVAYTFPYMSDSTFTINYILSTRDSVVKDIEGSLKGSYMITDHFSGPLFQKFRFKDNYATETRGLWKMENDFMGGPFINLAVLDEANNRVVVIDGFVYAPTKDKRNFLRQVEAIAYSLRFPKPDVQLVANE